MATRRDRSEELRALARQLHRLMREHEVATTSRLKVSAPLSRILKHSPEWRAQRRHDDEVESGRSAKAPSFFTVVEAARELGVPICALVPTMDHQTITEPQRQVLTLFARWALSNFAKRADERAAYTNDFGDLTPYLTVAKQAYPHAANSKIGTDAQAEPEDVEVLASIAGVSRERLQVIQVRGDSMADRIHDGDEVLIDVQRRTPRNGEIVAVDRHHLGRTIGYWRREGSRCFLDKHNDVTIALESRDDHTILGTIIGIVWAPLGPLKRSH